MNATAPEFIDGPFGRLAYRKTAGAHPGILWLGGFRSDMLGTKAEFLDQWAWQNDIAFVRFDYSGHGESEGQFEDGAIGDWLQDAQCVFDVVTEGPQILIGSSMGAWVATLLAMARPDRIGGCVFIAPAPDFTERLMWPSFDDAQREALLRDGRLELPSDYSDDPEIITRKLIENGRQHLVLNDIVPIKVPVRILQGMSDEAVPWRHAIEFAELIEGDDVEVMLTKSGDHRLSTPADLRRLQSVAASLCRP